MTQKVVDVAVIGGGQAGLAAGFYLRRSGTDFVILDAQDEPGGAWPHAWESLRLFSPARNSSLPGWAMPSCNQGYPPAAHVVDYLTTYEKRYDLPVHRQVRIDAVHRDGDLLRLDSATTSWRARHVISATGTWWRPYLPYYPGRHDFPGRQLHTGQYRTPEEFHGQRALIVGGGNSAAQILADLAPHATTIWATRRPPRFLPDDLDGRALFELASRRYHALRTGTADPGGIGGLGDIVAVPPVRQARDRGALHARPMFSHLTPTGVAWPDGHTENIDAIIWCTGFRPTLSHLTPLGLRDRTGRIPTGGGTRALTEPRLHLLGYGDWTGPGSATLVGSARTARDAVGEITAHLGR
ncbi:NAD(P)/FAD-dependent oxidoreductase [Actinomadura soli]|uniref:NAD(P)/FAD-dependent oxidoreductase n=1 Tax=Actinomadura soli TaxID=2508997 RepID=A0A5C4J5Q1_9ACTN|nr:ArsO family NAD(P)H-dependent flavin-containing monooxygenase [Actinomadura soli]TMQ92213.1 NAD(P)/FAD-dependent oxidoreductase [Actinomadura soli]